MQATQAIARQFNVDPGSLACLEQFLKDNIAKNREAFIVATAEQRSQIIADGVRAWHEHSQRLLGEMIDNRTEWAQAARRHIAADVYARVRQQPVTSEGA